MILRVFALFATNADRCQKNILDEFLNHALIELISDWDDEKWEMVIRGLKSRLEEIKPNQ